MGTLVNHGRGIGVVISTGMNTQIGIIAEMLQSVEMEPTPLQRRLDQLGKTLGWAAIAVCALVFLVGWIRGFNPLDMVALRQDMTEHRQNLKRNLYSTIPQ